MNDRDSSLREARIVFCGDTTPHDEHEYLRGVRTYQCEGALGCTGSPRCKAEMHIHGCFNDFANCDDPEAHRV